MSNKNVQLVREYIEKIQNQKQFDHIFEYCSHDCVLHIAPYVGIGLEMDERSGDHIILLEVSPYGPAHGKLLPGDELLRVQDEHQLWDTFDGLKSGTWGQGVLGTPLTVTVHREGKRLEIPLVRSRIEGWDLKLSTIVDLWRDDVLKNWPDLKTQIKLIFGQDDLVSCYSIVSGTNLEYHRAAVWSECTIYRIADGRIIESWGVEDSVASIKQLGYTIREPEKVTA